MHRDKTPADIEMALSKLMPVALSDRTVEEIESSLDRLATEAGDTNSVVEGSFGWKKISGLAALLAAGVFTLVSVVPDRTPDNEVTEVETVDVESKFVFLTEAERVEEVEDEGVFIDSGGSAVRRIRVRMIGERRMRDEETGIVMKLTEPREETYIVPVSKF